MSFALRASTRQPITNAPIVATIVKIAPSTLQSALCVRTSMRPCLTARIASSTLQSCNVARANTCRSCQEETVRLTMSHASHAAAIATDVTRAQANANSVSQTTPSTLMANLVPAFPLVTARTHLVLSTAKLSAYHLGIPKIDSLLLLRIGRLRSTGERRVWLTLSELRAVAVVAGPSWRLE